MARRTPQINSRSPEGLCAGGDRSVCLLNDLGGTTRLQQARKILTRALDNAARVMRHHGLLRGGDIHIRQRGRDDTAMRLD